MINVFNPVLKHLKLDNICIDNNVFRLHYKATVILLIVFSILVTSKQYIGDPIDCISTAGIKRETFNTFCWIFSTYTITDHNGITQELHHKYYQWVSIVLVLQAVMFYIPRYMWKCWENGRIKALTQDLVGPLVSQEQWTTARRNYLVSYLSELNKATHAFYAIRFVICEILNFGNVVGQFFIVNLFLGGEFANYGPAVSVFLSENIMTSTYWSDNDPMSRIFPKTAKCSFTDIGPSGTKQIKDALCVLPLNIVNEKLYAVLWFWFVGLALLSGLALIYRAVVFCCPEVRVWLLMAQTKNISKGVIRNLVYSCHVGDWFILQQLYKNLHPDIFRELINDLGLEADTKTVIL
ncbi:innexin inx2-like [Ctenocephalides felis]|uniref:innexin inx2-like n=1 Tax=Ctenocephalides felis TaxID=7515 RepID=UPI000E6E4473|nr:innexin inx2-like [Ctenocephalides felis]